MYQIVCIMNAWVCSMYQIVCSMYAWICNMYQIVCMLEYVVCIKKGSTWLVHYISSVLKSQGHNLNQFIACFLTSDFDRSILHSFSLDGNQWPGYSSKTLLLCSKVIQVCSMQMREVWFFPLWYIEQDLINGITYTLI